MDLVSYDFYPARQKADARQQRRPRKLRSALPEPNVDGAGGGTKDPEKSGQQVA